MKYNYEEEKKSKAKEYALIRVGENELLKLFDSFNASEKEFREYIKLNELKFKKGEIQYYVIREDKTYIAQLTLIFDNPNIENSTIKNKRVYFQHLSIAKNRANIGFEKLLLELVISKLQERRKNKIPIFEYTISVGHRERKIKEVLESLNFEEHIEYINKSTLRKEILYLREDKEK